MALARQARRWIASTGGAERLVRHVQVYGGAGVLSVPAPVQVEPST
jgi:hypothetical protein